MSAVNELIARYGTAQALTLLNAQITSAQAVAAGIKVPYPNFTNPAVQVSRTVAQSLRPIRSTFGLNVQVGGGDKTGKSALSRRGRENQSAALGWRHDTGQLRILADHDRCRQLQRQRRVAGCSTAGTGVGPRSLRRPAQLQAEHRGPAAVRRRPTLAQYRHRQPDPGRLARRSHSVVLFRQTARCNGNRATSDFQLDQSPERDGGRLACANSRRRVQPARGQVPESGRVRPARRRIGQCSITSTPMCGLPGP